VNTPAVSVIVTCYNLGQYLEEAVDSVLEQTFKDFEIVVIDDGSTDPETVTRLKHLEGPRTRVIRIENRGLPGARNEGFRHSSGRLLCALDADDRLAPTWLEKAVAFLDANPHITFVSHWLRTFGDESADWTPDRCDLETLLTVNTINGAALVRREAMAQVGGYDETMVHGCEDWDFWLSLLERGFAGAIIPEVLFFYRRRHDSMSREMSKGDRFQALLETLVRKHEASYRQHIAGLVAAREADLARTRYEVTKLQMEHAATVEPQVARSRQRLSALRDKVSRVQREQVPATELNALRQTLEEAHVRLATADAERHRLGRELAANAAEANRLRGELAVSAAEAGRLNTEVSDLRASLTWRLTRPVRAIVDWLRRPGGA